MSIFAIQSIIGLLGSSDLKSSRAAAPHSQKTEIDISS